MADSIALLINLKFLEVDSLVESVLDDSPIDNLPNVLQVIRSQVLVLQIISMLPYINCEKWRFAISVDQILILSFLKTEGLGDRIKSEPAPT